MSAILVCYGTGEGQTANVAERIADELAARGHETTSMDATAVGSDLDVDTYDAVLVGASVHFGRHQQAVPRFVRTNGDRLATMPSGCFQVSGSSADEAGAAEAARYVDEIIETTGWRPDRIGLFGGAIRFSEFGFLLRGLMRRVASTTFPDGVDASGDVECTDWDEVVAFADAFGAFVEERLGEAVEAG